MRLIVIVLVLVAAGMALYAYRSGQEKMVPAEKEFSEESPADIDRKTSPGKRPLEAPQSGRKTSRPAELAIIVDDIGYDLAAVKELLTIDAPLTFAVLPYSPHAREASEMIRRAGKEILLHLPMEPWRRGGEEPGTLRTSMTDGELNRKVREALDALPSAVGVNNHMGSRFMEDAEKLSAVFSVIKDRGLFFVDSRTTPHSMGDRIAGRLGMPFASRKIFIDNSQDYEDILLLLVSQRAERKTLPGSPLILIGHPHPTTVQALKDAIPMLKEQGFDLVPVSRMVQIQKKKAD